MIEDLTAWQNRPQVNVRGDVDRYDGQAVSQVATGTANGADGTTGEQTVDLRDVIMYRRRWMPAANYGSQLACVDTANGNANVPVGADNAVSVASER